MSDELQWVDAYETAQLLGAGKVSPTEVVEAAIRRVEAAADLNAVVIPLFDEAIAAARAVDRGAPLAGVPFALKEVGAHQANQPQYLGNVTLRDLDRRTPEDSSLGARYRRAGLITLGKTNAPEFGTYPDTDNAAFGPTLNPWDRTRSTSGSSGGSAAAVAAGLVPVAHGNDAAGSIRMPASWCGVVGFKPSRGRNPALPGWASSYFCVEHVLTRTVRDAALVLDLTCGPDPSELFHAPPPVSPSFLEAALHPSASSLRIGVLADAPVAVDPAVQSAVDATAKALEAMGHKVEVSQPEGLFDNARFAHLGAHNAFGRNAITQAFAQAGVEPDADRFGPVAKQMWDNTAATAMTVIEDSDWWQTWRDRVLPWWEDFDILITPTTGCPALPMADVAVDPQAPMMKMFTTLGPAMAFGQIFNMSGQPAISLPCGETADGLPVGVQLVGAFGKDDVVLSAAAQVEAALPWAHRRPPASEVR